MKKIILIGWASIAFSCLPQGECTDVSSNIVKVGFYNSSDRKTKNVALDSVAVVGADTILYKGKTVNNVALPLNPEWKTITFQLYTADSVTSLEVNYTIKAFALAPDCTAIELYTVSDAACATVNDGITLNDIIFKKREITRNDEENLKIYF